MFTRSFFTLGLLSLACATCASAQGPAATPAPEASVPTVASPASECSTGFSNVTLAHFSDGTTPLPNGTLRITARRGWVEDRDKAPVAYRMQDGAKPVEQVTVPIKDGALAETVCLPYTRAYGARPTRYEFTVWDGKSAEAPLMTLTADVTGPKFSLDDEIVYLGGTGDAPQTTTTVTTNEKPSWFRSVAMRLSH